MNNIESDNAALIAATPPLDPAGLALRALADEFGRKSRECDGISAGHVDDASRHAAERNIFSAREDLDYAVAAGHQSTAWYLAARRIEEEIDRLHNASHDD